MESTPQRPKPGLPQGPRRKRLKIGIACQSCRSKKTKCDGIRPACSNCQKKDSLRRNCTYITAGDRVSDVPSPSQPDSPVAVESHQSRVTEEVSGDRHPAADSYYSSAPAVFAGEVTAAIDARLGYRSEGRPSSTPMTDAPLFGLISRHHNHSLHDVENVLPRRKHADHLTNIYWRYIQPLEPILDKEGFAQSYQALFAGSLPDDEDERIFLSSLNTVFALATQLQENLLAEQRDSASNTYFQRAWALLRPETILWGPGSLEVVQCLLLMSRYLQCTNNPHQTWMAVGSAVRIAQSLGLNMADGPSSGSSLAESNLRRQLWQCCVFMDRGISWVLGRASTATLSIPPTRGDSQWLSMEDQNCGPYDCYFTKMLELYEIANHTMLSQMPRGSSLGDHLGLPRLYQKDQYLSTVVHIDSCLSKWEKSLPMFLRLEHGNADDFSYRQSVIVRFRLLHGRIVLFRPILARFCLSQSAALNTPLDQSLEDSLLQSSAAICIDCAEKMINLIHDHHNPDGTIGALPWWHRIFYLHIAGTILIASMMRDDLFTPTVAQSWSKAMSTLRAHEHLSPFVQQCVTNFEALSSKISETRYSGEGTQPSVPDRSSGTYFQDVFQDIGFDPDNFLFGKEDMAWLSNIESIE